MDLAMLLTCVAVLLACSFIFWTSANKTNSCKNKTAPLVSGAWPIIGHLHMLMGKELPHHLLSKLAGKYGPAFMLKYGSQPVIVISGLKLAKECFIQNDRSVFKRPTIKALKSFSYNEASLGFAPYGPLWVEMRHVSKANLLSNQRLQMQRHVRASELDSSIKELYQLWTSKSNDHIGTPLLVEMNKWLEELTLNVVTRMLSGKRNMGSKARRGGDEDDQNEAKHYKKVIVEATLLTGKLVVSDFFPSLEWVDYLRGDESALKATTKELDAILATWVEEHKQKRLSPGWEDQEQDFIDLTLSMINETQHQGVDVQTFIKSMCVAILFGGSDSTSVALTWTLSILMNHRDVLKKAQEEIDQHVGKDRKVDDKDVVKLVYLNAIVKESMRLCLVGPLIERITVEDCEIGGFHVKAGTRVVVNIWKMQRDPELWSDDPCAFRPERFLTTNANVELRGQNFELIPFGSGSRMCPGVTFALELIHLTLARLIHGFELGTPGDMEVDMTETSSVTNCKATPLEILLTPRLKPKLYDC
ncbi:Cytochrome p450 [Thalictrum thalictroides]|uniref:Cytochrome p450 n=1 Tax=Thalictrum thalictroides TaxID=46969 RepID=A0A7J6V9V4_THATH|nr:Cytochrome p450 [Thalictrum thalictroides]